VKVALVGTGGVAQCHIGVLRQFPDVEIVAHVSSELARAEAQAAAAGGHGYVDIAEMLDREHPDAVWLCVTPDRHGPAEHALLDRDVPFFVEKPLSVDLEPALAIAARIAAAGMVVAVGYKFRALDTLPRVRSLLVETPPRMVFGAWHDAMPPPPWWRRSQRSGGQLVEQATHLVDLARFLTGEASVVSAQAARWPRQDAPDSDVPDVHTALLRFGDVPAVFTATSLLRGRQAIHLQLICEGRAITITEQHALIETGRETHQFATAADPFRVEDRVFLEAVRTRNPGAVLSTYADALETHRLCCQIRELSASDP
jgi:myo-inositol 2-dehydrogenase / D-chiro-inositol 1-dehydrogenase